MDWDHMNKTAARSGSFVGKSRADEDAYYAAFANNDSASSITTAIAALRAAMERLPIAPRHAPVFK